MALAIEERATQFQTTVDGHEAHVDFERTQGTLVITHTVVPAEIGGRGVAAELVKSVFDAARRDGLMVSPVCSYAAGWLQKHPDYADLLR
ncbi:MAG: GNAT family N-acetyltransferase [Lysobacterales bacterium]